MTKPEIKNKNGGIVFTAKIVPGSSKTAVCGTLGKMIKFKVAAPPEKGKANQQLIEYLAKILGVKKQDVTVISGHTNPVKEIEVTKISDQDLIEKLHLDRKTD